MENSQTIQNEALNTVIHVKIWAGSYLVKNKIPKIKYKKKYPSFFTFTKANSCKSCFLATTKGRKNAMKMSLIKIGFLAKRKIRSQICGKNQNRHTTFSVGFKDLYTPTPVNITRVKVINVYGDRKREMRSGSLQTMRRYRALYVLS